MASQACASTYQAWGLETAAAAPAFRGSCWGLRDLCREHCGGDLFLFFKVCFIDSFLKIYCGGASLEDRTVCQLTQDLVEFYHLLYSEPRFPSQEALDRPLFFVSLSLSSLSLSLKKQKTQAEGGD